MSETFTEGKEALVIVFSVDEKSNSRDARLREDLGLDSLSLSKISEYLYSCKSAFSVKKANFFNCPRIG